MSIFGNDYSNIRKSPIIEKIRRKLKISLSYYVQISMQIMKLSFIFVLTSIVFDFYSFEIYKKKQDRQKKKVSRKLEGESENVS